MSRWNNQNLLQDKILLQAAKDDWQKSGIEQNYQLLLYTKEDLEQEVKQFEIKIVEFLNIYVKI